eukprot:TRINITY_DN21108_c0_g1_i1.p3 TRINITY_DN21108_c0_g1~~TRINITY_DN21108_c0_g1_i1.p3  ORF type:complete len:121 (+),score=39.03 TRINITY_DN21108_c0_g1_i1:55-417(+)
MVHMRAVAVLLVAAVAAAAAQTCAPGLQVCGGYNTVCCNTTTQDCKLGCVGAYHTAACVPHGWQCCYYGNPFNPAEQQCCANFQPGGTICSRNATCCPYNPNNTCCEPPLKCSEDGASCV